MEADGDKIPVVGFAVRKIRGMNNADRSIANERIANIFLKRNNIGMFIFIIRKMLLLS